MKKTVLSTLTCVVLISTPAWACKFTVNEESRTPTVGKTTVLTIEFRQTHRNCRESLSSVKLEPKGMEILSATPWKEADQGIFERKLKVKITNTDCSLNISRTCKKGGFNNDFEILSNVVDEDLRSVST